MMTLLKCEVTEGPREGYKAVGVASAEGFTEYFSIEERFLVNDGGTYRLPVRVIGNDKKNKTYLIQLPVEADSGANRVWVTEDALSDMLNEAIA
jgi:hypothetical protein